MTIVAHVQIGQFTTHSEFNRGKYMDGLPLYRIASLLRRHLAQHNGGQHDPARSGSATECVVWV
ncbi:MAG: hypothetical protein VB142_08695 [Burkholderia sp.]